ncbi:ABC transporter permease [Caldibacillus lycopersici]|uniref:ABC transporter permease n=1 Tax=Perspicuibacillus lycopersici TaxID=1325689 RepID=A0AAE3LLM6_9BACI|nr:ABC transporter permease [Perspicuibacillus lycopersici]MCU9612505.1 ABC transporter permease [Perspicuibacillus lycopersici]
MNSKNLWSKRAVERLKEVARYGKYMFNDHLLFVVIIAIGAGAYYYQDWVSGLTAEFPTPILFAIVFGLLLTSGTVMTFFKEPDKVFLLPLETTLKPYIIRSFLLTIVWHLYLLFICLLVLAPIYVNTIINGYSFFLFAAVIFLLKIINLTVRWFVDYDPDKNSIWWDYFIRLLLNGIIIFFYLNETTSLLIASLAIFIIYTVYFGWKSKESGLPWERLIENEVKRMGRFYRIANLFSDVPQLKNEVKRRKWLDIFIRNISLSSEKTYIYLLARTFFRSGDYFGLFVRLTVISSVLIVGFEGSFVGYGIALIFIYLTGFQLLSLWKHHDAIIWTDLYPVSQGVKNKAFLKLILNILWTQNLVFTILFLFSTQWVRGMLLFVILSIFIYLFVYVYCQSRLNKWESE